MSGNSTKDWAEAHWAPLTGEKTELTQFNIWHHRRFGFVDHRDAACGNRWLAWTASREALVIELPQIVGYEAGYDSIRENEYASQSGELFDADEVFALCRSIEVREAIEAAGVKVKP